MELQNLEQKCINHKIARQQRKKEVEAGLGLAGTKGFQRTGCYDCDGYKQVCTTYQPYIYKK